jgi:hypothetical protein
MGSNFSEEFSATIFKAISSVIKMEVAASFGTLVPIYQTAWRQIREDRDSDIQPQEHLKSEIIRLIYWVRTEEVTLCSLVDYNVSGDVAASIYPED